MNSDAADLGRHNGPAGESPEVTSRQDSQRDPVAGMSRHAAEDRAQEITMRELYTLFGRSKWLIISLTVAAAIATLTAALILPKKYRATAWVAVASSSQTSGRMGGLGSVLSQFGGFASLMGLSGQITSAKAEDVATLKSQVLARRFIRQNNLLPIFFAKRWDARTGQWRTNGSLTKPTLWDANQFFKNSVRTVTVDKKTGLIRVSITWTDPKLAAQWANGLVAMTNAYLRDKAIREANRNIAYLQKKVKTASDVGVQQGIYSLMQQEIGDAMVAQGRRQYALKVIDPAFAPERPYSPRPKLWALVGMVSGFLLSLGIVIFKASWNAGY